MTGNGFEFLQGTWKCVVSGSLGYGRVVGGELRFAYCFGGNDRLTGHYFNWQVAEGGALVARFKWANGALTGYTHLKRVSEDRLEGGWWSALSAQAHQPARPTRMVNSIWVRQAGEGGPPEWAETFFTLPKQP
ncbi:MAG TPA: hypothetical protein VF815_43875 [Myxococcaceae bacterium]|jgi:hypothetical protein